MNSIMIQMSAITAFCITITACPAEQGDDGAMLAATAMAVNTGASSAPALSTEQQTASKISSATVGAVTSATTALSSVVSVSGNSRDQDVLHVARDILRNGGDPVFARDRLQDAPEAQSTSRNHCQFTVTDNAYTTDTDPNYQYSYEWSTDFEGCVDGYLYEAQETTTDMSLLIPGCSITMTTYTPVSQQGDITFSSAHMDAISKNNYSYTDTGSSSDGYLKYDSNLTMTFNNYASMYYDQYEYYRQLKESIDNGTFITDYTAMSCEDYQASIDSYYNMMTISTFDSGSVSTTGSYESTSSYNSSYDADTMAYSSISSSQGNSQTTAATTDLMIDGEAVTFDMTYTVVSDFTMSLSGQEGSGSTGYNYGAPDGSITIGFTGTVNGKLIDDSITIDFGN